MTGHVQLINQVCLHFSCGLSMPYTASCLPHMCLQLSLCSLTFSATHAFLLVSKSGSGHVEGNVIVGAYAPAAHCAGAVLA